MAENDTALAVRESTDVTAATETNTAALAASAKATVEARYLVAYSHPRNLDTVRHRLLDACRRPKFAESARYRKPVGNQSIEGPSVRFAEEAIRAMTNLSVDCPITYDDSRRVVATVTVTDLENNVALSQDTKVEKTVERLYPDDRQILGQRTNSRGKTTYTVVATEEEVATKLQAAVSKVRRGLILQHLPADILEEAMDQAIETVRDRDAKDPTAARKGLLDAFHAIGISADAVSAYLGHDPAQLDPAELSELRAVFTAIREKVASWPEVLRAKQQERGEAPEAAGKRAKGNGKAGQAKSVLDKIRARGKAPKSDPANVAPPPASSPEAAPEAAPEPAKRGRGKGKPKAPTAAASAPAAAPSDPAQEDPRYEGLEPWEIEELKRQSAAAAGRE
jgi:hypothetical protein